MVDSLAGLASLSYVETSSNSFEVKLIFWSFVRGNQYFFQIFENEEHVV
jgi:hypothetical protein